MNAAEGILAARGGSTSHAAVVARGMGKCCVAGCSALEIDYANKRLVEYEKYAINNSDLINEIIELKEYIEDLQYWKDKTSFIQDLISDIDYYDNGIEEVCCKIN